MNNGSLRNIGYDGYYWSSTASTNISTVFFFDVGAGDTYPSRSFARWYGFSVRCVDGGSYVRSGQVNIGEYAATRVANRIIWPANDSYSWGATSGNELKAFWFQIQSEIIFPAQGPYGRYIGFPLRCLAW